LVVLIDQASKLWIINNLPHWESWNIIGSFVRFTHVKNPGIAFGISVGDFTMIVAVLSIVATFFIAYMHWQERKNHPLIVIGLGLILGGAIGNLIDRSSIFFSKHYEGVVDFIDIGTANFRWYTFNVADSAVTIGIIFYLIHSLFTNKPELLEVND
jgi:signal peptidase II